MATIRFRNHTKSGLLAETFEPTIRTVLSKYGITDNVEVELNIVGTARMRQLNREFRSKDYATDVLSFPIWPDLQTIKQQQGQVLLGSIVVCLPVAARDAQNEHQTTEEKIAFLIEHSLLHLMGFHHEGD